MKPIASFRGICGVISTLVAAVLLTGCASTPKQVGPIPMETGRSKEAILAHADVKGKTPILFEFPIAPVREAGLRALNFVGCEIKKHETYYLSGRRPNKMGLFVGSGGETVELFLNPETETRTQVWVDTDMSFVGIAGQQGWNDQVIAEMRNILNKPVQ